MFRREFEREDVRMTLYEEAGQWWIRASAQGIGEGSAPLDMTALREAVLLDGGTTELQSRLAEQGYAVGADQLGTGDTLEINRAVGRHLFQAITPGSAGDVLRSWLADSGYFARVVLRFEVRELAVLGWEMLRESEGDVLRNANEWPVHVVRAVDDPPDVASQPLRTPIHVAQFDLRWGSLRVPEATAETPVDVADLVADVFRSSETGIPHEDMETVYRVRSLPISGGDEFDRLHNQFVTGEPPQEWERMDILHVTGLQSASTPEQLERGLLLPGGTATRAQVDQVRRLLDIPPEPEQVPGVPMLIDLAKLLVVLKRARTRLLVLQVSWRERDAERRYRVLARAIAERGGPPVLLCRFPYRADGAVEFFRRFYDALIHDYPADAARQAAEEASGQEGQTALTAGPRAEELVRPSALLQRTYRHRDEAQARLRQVLSFLDRIEEQRPSEPGWGDVEGQAVMAERDNLVAAEDVMRLLSGAWPMDWDHESTSSIPLVTNANRVEEVMSTIAAVERRIEDVVRMAPVDFGVQGPSPAPEPPQPRAGRHVNTWLVEGNSRQRVSARQPLWLHRSYQLRVNIGPLAGESTVVNPVEIPAEALEPIFEAGGDWVHVAVYGVGVEVSNQLESYEESGYVERPGSAMRRLWLPASGASEALFFGLDLQRPGLVYLRICVYYRNQLLQSLRLDVRVVGRRGDDLTQLPGIGPARRERLAAIGFRSVGDVAAAELEDYYRMRDAAAVPWQVAWEWPRAAQALVEAEDDPLLEVPGLDRTVAAQMREVGIAGLDDLAGAAPVNVAATAGVRPSIARDWVETARRLRRLGYETYVEYTIVADMIDFGELRERTVSVFTNESNGTHAIGVKLGAWDEAWGTEDDWTGMTMIPQQGLNERLGVIRNTLDTAAIVELSGRDTYVFGNSNRGTEERLTKTLKDLALKGRALYNEIFDMDAKTELFRHLQAAGQIIHVARVMEGDVLPWSIVYDLDLDVAEEPERVCLDLLNHLDGEGRLDYAACSGQGECPLKSDHRERVVCPWGFWGIKHILEQPPQRIREKAVPRKLNTEIYAVGAAKLAMNVSTRLMLLQEHKDQMEKLSGVTQPLPYAGDDRSEVGGRPKPRGKDQVLQALKDEGLHIIYFYCHGGTTEEPTGWPRPYLSVGQEEKGWILPDNLMSIDRETGQPVYKWPAHPLVFVNGCRTAGLEPTVMGHFVQTFAELGASGVIGTEVRVWEQLATWFAQRFFELFLDGRRVGQILRDLRHELLRMYNPLGLVYTNYCSADLCLLTANQRSAHMSPVG